VVIDTRTALAGFGIDSIGDAVAILVIAVLVDAAVAVAIETAVDRVGDIVRAVVVAVHVTQVRYAVAIGIARRRGSLAAVIQHAVLVRVDETGFDDIGQRVVVA